jgi:rubrerythrin
MEEEELRKKIARIHTAILTHTPVGRDENDFPVAATQTYLYDFISQKLDKAREEGKGRKLQGWECPKCGSVYSPLTFECPTCKNSGIKVRTSDRTSGYDNTSYLN